MAKKQDSHVKSEKPKTEFPETNVPREESKVITPNTKDAELGNRESRVVPPTGV
jgi:hypothetical protein